jgi:hypothetical protein
MQDEAIMSYYCMSLEWQKYEHYMMSKFIRKYENIGTFLICHESTEQCTILGILSLGN